MSSEFTEGAVISFGYRAANYQGMRASWKPRKLLPGRVQRWESEPLDPITAVLAPHWNRGQTLMS